MAIFNSEVLNNQRVDVLILIKSWRKLEFSNPWMASSEASNQYPRIDHQEQLYPAKLERCYVGESMAFRNSLTTQSMFRIMYGQRNHSN